ncbi:MAG: recombinase family protein [Peptococcaceae bacterium]
MRWTGGANSISNQKKILRQYAKERHFPNPLFFVNGGNSGTSFERPGFQKMPDEIEAGRVSVRSTVLCLPPVTGGMFTGNGRISVRWEE